jgi:hypothetical protein
MRARAAVGTRAPRSVLAGSGDQKPRVNAMSTILLVILVILLIGALPSWPYSAGWGYYPSSGLGLVLIILVVLLAMGRI